MIANAFRSSFSCLASADLPIYSSAAMRMMVFGEDPRDPEVVALVHKRDGADPAEAVLRMHSACITGDVFGSIKCDCGAQLRIALDTVARAPHGIVLYLLRHEGRGIGLVNKIRAYALQDQGFDTVEANTALGFEPDAREFAPAAAALMALGVRRVRLLTNNPQKTSALERAGIHVVARIPMDPPITEYNRQYLETKRRYFGHMPGRDPMTDCLTPEAFGELFQVQLAGTANWGPVSAIGIVVDGHAELKASHGAEVGDRLMHAAARQLGRWVRKNEPLTRIGEDRFLLILHAGPEVASQVVQRLRDAMADAVFEDQMISMPLRVEIRAHSIEARREAADLLAEAIRVVFERSAA